MSKRGAYKKKEKSVQNVRERHNLLENGLKKPGTIRGHVIKALSGQRAFCSLSIPGTKVEPISLNTLKTISRELYTDENRTTVDGFVYLDAMRIELNKLMDGTSTGRTNEAKAERHKKLSDVLANRLQQVELQNILRSKAYVDLMGRVKKLASVAGVEELMKLHLLKILSDHQVMYADLFNPQPAVSSGEVAVILPLPIR